MALELKGNRPPEKVKTANRKVVIAAVVAKHKGKRVSQITKQEQDELLEAIAQTLGLADESGAVT